MQVKITVSALAKYEMLQQELYIADKGELYIADKGDPNISFSFESSLLFLEREDAKKTNKLINQPTNLAICRKEDWTLTFQILHIWILDRTDGEI